ncbi:hypothetical protein SAE02_76750 [Skermanella aerolata]|uniref:Electron transporter SenC n=1 Tax=Skermanella aerolata TaxID=393310 RepID=A0A512E492_9PROT|nr:SCO family protein [Skermanella aerolata]KJB90067.1 hypothetical protein N826_07405 [Skermanella aerolata KACC 11604]GEO43527.1 hypothetical protein SAE02_76750 [Skermanella aerolata]
MYTITHLKRAGRTAAVAGILMGGPVLYFSASLTFAHDGHHQAAQTAGPASGHGGPAPAVSAEQAGGHGGYGAHSGWPEPKQLGGDFSLTDHTGRKVTLADFKGKATAFYFGYTQCGDICPIIGTKLGMAVDLMGDKADQVNIAMVSVDDRNDGPEQLAAFVAKQHPRLIGLSGSRKEIYDIAARFRVRRDYVMQNQVVREGAGEIGVDTDEAHGGHISHQTPLQNETGTVGETAVSSNVHQAGAAIPDGSAKRIRIRSASDDATRLHNMAMAHTTHIYLLDSQGQVVRYIYPSLTPEQLARQLTDLLGEG